MPLSGSISVMKYLWLLNALAQSSLWAHIIKIYTTMLSDRQLPRAIVAIHTTGAAGSVGVYALSSLILKFFNWKDSFYTAAVLLAAMAITWNIGMNRLNAASRRREGSSDEIKIAPPSTAPPWTKTRSNFAPLVAAGLLTTVFACIVNGALRDGIMLWLPSYLNSSYGLGSALSVFISVIVPACQILGAFIARALVKSIPRLFHAAAVLFLVSMISMGVLAAFPGIGIFFCCGLFAITSTSMTAVNTIIVSFWPVSLKQFGSASLAAGMVNSFVYVGSMVSSIGFGALSDRFGWGSVVFALLGGAFFGLIACLIGGFRHSTIKTGPGKHP
jgi:OPA family glycerol-3-phosphate transporter-like MFS transporter